MASFFIHKTGEEPSDVTSVELNQNFSDFLKRQITTTQGQAVILTNINLDCFDECASNTRDIVTLAGNSVTSLDLTLDQVGILTKPNQGVLHLSGTELTTLNITLANNASTLSITGATDPISFEQLNVLKTLNIVGDQDFTARDTRRLDKD